MIEKLSSEDYKIKINDYTLKNNVFFNHKPLIILFSAVWCFPCKALYPLVEKIASENSSILDVYKVDIDAADAVELTSFMKIRSVPTLVFINSLGEINKTSGLCSENQLRINIATYLNL